MSAASAFTNRKGETCTWCYYCGSSVLLLHLLKKVLKRETIALDVALVMMECETTDAREPLSISTVARTSNRIQRSFVTVTMDTTRRRRLQSSVLMAPAVTFGRVGDSHISECLSRRRIFIQTFQGHIETTLLQMCTRGASRIIYEL